MPCSHCGECGHNYRGCPTMDPEEKKKKIQELKDKKEQAARRRRGVQQRFEAQRRVEQRVSYSVENKNDYEVTLYWGLNEGNLLKRFMYLAPFTTASFKCLKNEHQILIVPTLDVILDHGVEAKKDIDIQTYNKNISFHIQMKDYPDTNIILQQEIKPQKTELDQWKEAGLKSHYLLEQVIKMGGKKYDNLEPMLDMVQDINIPEHSDHDRELAGVPSKLTNIT